MSGGHFYYSQSKIMEIADEVEQLILTNNDSTPGEYGGTVGNFYAPDIIEEFKNGLGYLQKAYIYAQRIDWLVSSDDGEDCFRRRLKEELAKVPERSKVCN